VFWVHPLSGCSQNGVFPVVAGSLAEDGFDQVAPGQLAHEERSADDVLFEVVSELRGDEVTQNVVMVVDWG
jgi:hypothetical protein